MSIISYEKKVLPCLGALALLPEGRSWKRLWLFAEKAQVIRKARRLEIAKTC